jgi:undecaprenyl-diphosphatase
MAWKQFAPGGWGTVAGSGRRKEGGGRMASSSRANAPVWPRNRAGRSGPVGAAGGRVPWSYREDGLGASSRAAASGAGHRGEHQARDFALSVVLLGLVLCGLLASVALAIWAHDVPHSWKDVTIESDVRAHMSPPLTALLYTISRIGNPKGIAVTIPLLVGLLLWRRRPAQAVTLLMSVVGGAAIASTFKPLVGRLGPGATAVPDGLFGFNSYAFPSGHAVYFITCCVPLIWFLCAWRPQGTLGRRAALESLRTLACAGLLILMLLGGFSQVYLAYHWPSDIAGGYAIGGFWAGLVLLAYMRFGRDLDARAARPRALPIHPHL